MVYLVYRVDGIIIIRGSRQAIAEVLKAVPVALPPLPQLDKEHDKIFSDLASKCVTQLLKHII